MRMSATIAFWAMSALSAAAAPLATMQWTSNYVARATAQPSGATIAAIINSGVMQQFYGGEGAADFVPSNGVSIVRYAVAETNGTVSMVEKRYSLSVETIATPPFHGALVVDSDLPECPTGTLYACVAPGQLFCGALTGGCARLSFEKSDGRWFVYSDVADGREWDSLGYPDRIEVITWGYTNGVRQIQGAFTIVPHSLTDDEFNAAAAGETAATHEWCGNATNQSWSLAFTWTPVRAASALRSLRLRAAAPQGGGAVVVGLTYIGPGPIDWNEAYGGSQADDEEWQPGTDIPNGAWEAPSNWYVPIPTQVQFTDTDDYGNTVTTTLTVGQLFWDTLLANGTVTIPPYPHTYPTKVKVQDVCLKKGHIFGAHCKCTRGNCNATRQHAFEEKYPGKCDVCVNKIEVKGLGGRPEETKEICGDNDKPATGIVHHRGWHHTGPEGDDTDYYCSCECLAYSSASDAVHLEHAHEHDSYEQYDDSDHYDVRKCQRDPCHHVRRVKETHELDPDSENFSYVYVDREWHRITGVCKKCGAWVSGKLARHMWGFYGQDEHYCKCPCFFNLEGITEPEAIRQAVLNGAEPETSIHQPGVVAIVNQKGKIPKVTKEWQSPTNRFCVINACDRCGMFVDEDGAHLTEEQITGSHYWSFPDNGDGKESATYHWCACGLYKCMHLFEADPSSGEEMCVGGQGYISAGTADGGATADGMFNGTNPCGYSRTKGGADRRDGSDSTTIDPIGPTPPKDDEEDEDGKRENPILPPKNPKKPEKPEEPPEKPEDDDDEEWRNCPMVWPELEEEEELPILDMPLPDGPLGGDSSTIDPNTKRNIVPPEVSSPLPPVPMLPPDLIN